MAAINSTRTNPAMTAGILLRSLSAFIGQLAACPTDAQVAVQAVRPRAG